MRQSCASTARRAANASAHRSRAERYVPGVAASRTDDRRSNPVRRDVPADPCITLGQHPVRAGGHERVPRESASNGAGRGRRAARARAPFRKRRHVEAAPRRARGVTSPRSIARQVRLVGVPCSPQLGAALDAPAHSERGSRRAPRGGPIRSASTRGGRARQMLGFLARDLRERPPSRRTGDHRMDEVVEPRGQARIGNSLR